MIYRSKAPLRIGLAGGGTDVSPYCDLYGGAILNTTISHAAYASIETLDTNKIIVEALDRKEKQEVSWDTILPIDGELNLLKNAAFVYLLLLMLLQVRAWAPHLPLWWLF